MQLFKHVLETQTLKTIKSKDQFLAHVLKHDPQNQLILFRLPKAELQLVAMQPCPSPASIQSSKLLRQFTNTIEKDTCQLCPIKDCPQRNRAPLRLKQGQTVNLSDVYTVLFGFYELHKQSQFMTVATTLLQAADAVLEDLEQGGVEFNLLISDLEDKLESERVVHEPIIVKTKAELHQELDEIESLIQKLKKATSREQKRKLLAQFNQKQAQLWEKESQLKPVQEEIVQL